MKKILLGLFLFIISIQTINAECNSKDLSNLRTLANEITYETKYDYNDGYFDIIFYNVVDDLYIYYKDKIYYSDKNNTLTIKDVKQGLNVKASIKANLSGCNSEITVKYINLLYYNYFYGSDLCKGYDDLTACNSEFLSYPNSEQIVNNAIKNHEQKKADEIEIEIEHEEETLLIRVRKIINRWWLKVLLAVVTTAITLVIYNRFYRKIKHGI